MSLKHQAPKILRKGYSFRFHSAPIGLTVAALNWNLLIWVLLVPGLAVSTMWMEDPRQ